MLCAWQGIIHNASAVGDDMSAHLTIGLLREGRTWMDIFHSVCEDTAKHCDVLEQAVLAHATTAKGVEFWKQLAGAPHKESRTPKEICAVWEERAGLLDGSFVHAVSEFFSKPEMLVSLQYTKPTLPQLKQLNEALKCSAEPEEFAALIAQGRNESAQGRNESAQQSELARGRRTSYMPSCFPRCSCSSCDCDSSCKCLL